jgi:hypothetical protein
MILLAMLQETEGIIEHSLLSTEDREYQNTACKATGDGGNIRTVLVKLQDSKGMLQ